MVNFFKGGISDSDFLPIYQALKLDLADLSFGGIHLRKWILYLQTLPIFKKIKTFIAVEIPHLTQKMFKFPTPDKDDGQITAGCPGGMLKLRINLRIIWKVIKSTKAQFLGNSCHFAHLKSPRYVDLRR